MKFKSYGFWTSFAGATVVFLTVVGKSLDFEISEKIVSDIILGFAGILVVLGIVKMPKDNKQGQENKDNEDNENQDSINKVIEQEVESLLTAENNDDSEQNKKQD
jgi:uncharacterized membrane protein